MPTNSGRDRTSEFAAAVRSLKGRNMNHANHLVSSRDSKHAILAKQSQEFMTIASSIGRDIGKIVDSSSLVSKIDFRI